ncbi:hypothetical protein D9758_008561 [Tetrapyrgos nigripes]|uniref:AIG1-type G domain-containing protein n=1 Tax=Tetrapyrgos nigripes TaxID=182062 RepID=A0A8H5LIV7_9AGAR|nr:hypothetical protein D9758_008561 [Tetrapyrgos nigripes]
MHFKMATPTQDIDMNLAPPEDTSEFLLIDKPAVADPPVGSQAQTTLNPEDVSTPGPALTDVRTEPQDHLTTSDPASVAPMDMSPVLNDILALSKGVVRTDRNKEKVFTILLVGETGVGKTSVLSLLFNVLSGNRTENYMDFHDQGNEVEGSQRHSQTGSARLYEHTSVNGVTLRILDTPGLADTRGIQRDEMHKKSIAEAIQRSIVTVNAVLILANGTVPRLTVGTDYALSTLSSIFPRSLANNIGFLFTNVSSPLSWNFDPSALPLALQNNALFLLNNPIAMQKKYYQFVENPYTSAKLKSQFRRSVLSSEEEALNTLVEFFDWLDGLEPQPTFQILSLYDQSQHIETEIQNTLAVMHQAAQADKKLDEVQRKLEGAEMDMKTYEAYEAVINRKEWQQIPTSRHNTVCCVPDCYSNCHVPCNLDFTLDPEQLRGCTSMYESGGSHCCVCPHERKDHRHYNSIWELKEISEKRTNEDAKAKFERARDEKGGAEEMKKEIEEAQVDLQNLVQNATDDLGRLVERYSNLALSGSFTGQVEKAVGVLEQNLESMREKGAGAETIKKVEESLDQMRRKLEVLKKAKGRDVSFVQKAVTIARRLFAL